MRIVIFEARTRDKVFFRKHLSKDKLTYVEEPLSAHNAQKYKGAEAVCVFVFSQITAEVLEQLPKLKLIATRSTGFDHIAIKEAHRREIVVCNVPQYGENSVAEHTFALILNLSRNVHKSYIRSRHNNFEIEDIIGFELKDKWLGVIGAGSIGQHVIKIAKGFGMNVIAYDSHPNQFIAELLHYKYASSVEEVLKKADIITLHVPANKHTHHLINKQTLRLVKKTALLINTSRGEVVDTDALYEALTEKKLAGAGLDVIEGEQLVKEDKALLFNQDPEVMRKLIENKEILRMDNVVYTPHNAFSSKEALQRILEVTAHNIINAKNKTPSNVITSSS